ncbi:MAG TPA: hypothetical protein VND99_02795 [Candidatus Acidoferrales bacterium]|nr:hypothetical protein [Candidatus Acidoferrales bacterium]
MGINTGALYIIFIMLAILGVSYILSGPTPSQTPILTGPEVVINKKPANKAQAVLQLYNFNGATITPPVTSLCKKGGANVHPEAIVAYSPAQSNAVSAYGQIKIWVSDTKQPYIAPNEQIIKSSGAIKTPGNRAATAPDGYRWEPQLYVFPATVENNGKAYFPDLIQGDYFNGAPNVSYGSDILPPYALPLSSYTVEFVWNVSDIGLTDGDYEIEFVVHDGNQKLGVKCMNLRVYTPPASQNQQNKLPL